MTSRLGISTARLRILPFEERHITERYVGWLNDRALMRFSEQRHKHHTLESVRRYWQSFEGTPHYFWAIEEIERGLGHIGNINAYVDRKNLIADIGILIGALEAANQRLGLEAWVGVTNFLFEHEGLRKITAGTLSVNTSMLRLARRAGMTEDGIKKRHYLFDGREVDVIHFALFREQWSSLVASTISHLKGAY